jgi:hypothetical protein
MQRELIVAVVGRTYIEQKHVLDGLKNTAGTFGAHPDWPWKGIILSGATRGGSARWPQVECRYEGELAWDKIFPLADTQRHQRLLTVGRFKNRTAECLEQVFAHLKAVGGPAGLRRRLSSMNASQIIGFWCSFREIGDKYARNIMMDIYDSRFRNGFFAIDSRIGALLKVLGYDGPPKYAAQEFFLNELAAELQIESWELDRLLYNQNSGLQKQLTGS